MCLPEGVPLAGFAEVERPEVADGVRARFAPAHPGAFQSVAHHGLAGALDRPRADLPSFRNVARVVHAVEVVAEVIRYTLVSLLERGALREITRLQAGERRRAPFVLQLMTMPIEPGAAPLRFLHRSRLDSVPRDTPWRARNPKCKSLWESSDA